MYTESGVEPSFADIVDQMWEEYVAQHAKAKDERKFNNQISQSGSEKTHVSEIIHEWDPRDEREQGFIETVLAAFRSTGELGRLAMEVQAAHLLVTANEKGTGSAESGAIGRVVSRIKEDVRRMEADLRGRGGHQGGSSEGDLGFGNKVRDRAG